MSCHTHTYTKGHLKTKVNFAGKQLFNCVLNHGLVILNGYRELALIGDYTCVTYKGASITDNVLVLSGLLFQIVDFRVGDGYGGYHFPLQFISLSPACLLSPGPSFELLQGGKTLRPVGRSSE